MSNDPNITSPADSAAGRHGDQPVHLLPQIAVVISWRRFIVCMVVGVSILAGVAAFIIPESYTATTALLPSKDESSGFGLGALLKDSPLTNLALGSFANNSADLFAEMLKSRTVLDGVIDEAGLMTLYGIESRQRARERLQKSLSISVSDAGVITLKADGPTPDHAAKIANAFVRKLEMVNQQKNISRAKSTRIFVERRYLQAKVDLFNAEESLLKFQKSSRTISIEDQSRATIEAAVNLRTVIITREIERNILRQSFQPGHPRIKQLQAEIDELGRQLEEIDRGGSFSSPVSDHAPEGQSSRPGGDLYPPMSQIPALAVETLRLYREVKIQTAILEFITQQYEQAKIQETRDTPTLVILDEAVPPEFKSWPQRIYIVLAGAVVSLVCSLSAVFLIEHYRSLNQDADTQNRLSFILTPIKEDWQRLKRLYR